MTSLSDRIEALEIASGVMDAEAHCEVFGFEPRVDDFGARFWRDGKWIGLGSIPHYTASVNAALTLVPEGWRPELKRYRNGQWSAACTSERHGACADDCYTAATAMAAAAIRARGARP